MLSCGLQRQKTGVQKNDSVDISWEVVERQVRSFRESSSRWLLDAKISDLLGCQLHTETPNPTHEGLTYLDCSLFSSCSLLIPLGTFLVLDNKRHLMFTLT